MHPGDGVEIANWVRDRVVVASQGQRWWVANVAISLQHKWLPCADGVDKAKGKEGKKKQDGNPHPKRKIAKGPARLPSVPKMQFQPAIRDAFMPYPVPCNGQGKTKQVALVMLCPGSTTVVDALTVCNAEWEHRSAF